MWQHTPCSSLHLCKFSYTKIFQIHTVVVMGNCKGIWTWSIKHSVDKVKNKFTCQEFGEIPCVTWVRDLRVKMITIIIPGMEGDKKVSILTFQHEKHRTDGCIYTKFHSKQHIGHTPVSPAGCHGESIPHFKSLFFKVLGTVSWTSCLAREGPNREVILILSGYGS